LRRGIRQLAALAKDFEVEILPVMKPVRTLLDGLHDVVEALAEFAAWFFRYSHRGKEHEESTKTPDLKAAKRFAKHKLDEMAVDRQGKGPYQPALAARLQVDELLDDHEADNRLRGVKSLKQIQSHLKPIRTAFGDWRAADITGVQIDR
jgi:hypothetical protein